MTRIIKAEDGASQAGVLNLADLAQEARSIILDARKEAARIVAEARTKADEAHAGAGQKGYGEGFARGREEGYAHGKRQAHQDAQESLSADMSALADLARRIVGEMAGQRNELVEQARQELLEFALELAAKVVGEVAVGDVAAAKANLQKVLTMAQGQAQVTVKVNPQQLDDLKRHCRPVLEAMSSGLAVELVGDPEIAAGGLKLHSGRGVIDATIGTQLRNIASALLARPGEGKTDDE